jgi:hypothetical protein
MKIVQESQQYLDPRGTIEFDEYERNEYVSRFLAIFNSGESEERICEKVYAVHIEVCTRSDLYIAVADRLSSRQRSALRWYAACRGTYQPKSKIELEP